MTLNLAELSRKAHHLSPLKSFGWALLAGALYAAGFPIKGLPPLGFPTLIGLFLLFLLLSETIKSDEKPNLKKLMTILMGFSLGHYQLGFYWIPYTLKEFGGLPVPLNFLMGLGFSAIIVPQLWCFFASIYLLKRPLLKNFKLSQNPAFLAALITLLESFIPQQFPAHAGHVWMALPLLTKLAPYLGAPFYSFITYYAVISLIMGARLKAAALLGMTILTTLFIPSSWHELKSENTLTLKLVQPNVGNFMKIASEAGDTLAMSDVFNRYETLSLTGAPVDLIVWPETAYPRLLQSESIQEKNAPVPTLIKSILLASGSDLLTGGYDYNADNSRMTDFESEYNTTFLFSGSDQSLKETYHKMKLIPFGEGLPFGPLNSSLSKIITNISYFATGSKYSLFETKKEARFITPICYEILFDSFMREYLNHTEGHPHFILNLTNDSWYGITSEPYQHLFLAKWRASEFQLPLVRMTNTGITSILYPNGSESERIELDQAQSKNYTLEIKESAPTWFQRVGIFTVLIIMVTAILIEYLRLKNSKN